MSGKEGSLNIEKDQQRFRIKKVLDDLGELKSVSELERLVGEYTPEEQAMLNSPEFLAEPTPEELAQLGPNFTAGIMARRIKRSKRDSDIKNRSEVPPPIDISNKIK